MDGFALSRIGLKRLRSFFCKINTLLLRFKYLLLKRYMKSLNDFYLDFMNQDLITLKQAKEKGYCSQSLSLWVKQNKVYRVSRGLYSLDDQMFDAYFQLQLLNPSSVISHLSALYFHGFSDRIPQKMEVSVYQGYNASHIKKNFEQSKIHYVAKDYLHQDTTMAKTVFGNDIKISSLERCICEMVKSKHQQDPDVYRFAISKYFFEHDNFDEIIRVSRNFKIEKTIRTYIELF